MRHALGVLGVMAAGVLLLVSAAMNWRFGYQLGTTEFDGLIYGSASAAADCMKALIPFFIFAAIRNKMWAQAFASLVVWCVVIVYSLTSALGHAALNRQDTAGSRASEVLAYKDLRTDLERTKNRLGWIPQHRPAETIQSEVNGLQLKRQWKWTKGCSVAKSRSSRRFCDGYNGLKAELASANEAKKLEVRIAGIQEKLARQKGSVTHSSADPQAAVLAQLTAIVFADVKIEHVQMALIVFIALLLEVGSGLGLYIAFSQWRLHEPRQTALESNSPADSGMGSFAAVTARSAGFAVGATPIVANDNRSSPHIALPKQELVATNQAVETAYDKSEDTTTDITTATTAERNGVIEMSVHKPEANEAGESTSIENTNVREESNETQENDRQEATTDAHITANDNSSSLQSLETGVAKFKREKLADQAGSNLAATELYEAYCTWCDEEDREPLALPTFGRELNDLGVHKAKIAGRVRYIGITLRSRISRAEDKNMPALSVQAA
ncbi:MAG: hypothetical protein ACR2PG_09845 [Hyphomicrobiaceae bacterium]